MSKIRDILSVKDESRITEQVTQEYNAGYQHVQSWREDTKDVSKTYLIPKPAKNKVKVHLVRNKLKVRLSTLVSDEIAVQVVPMNGVLGQDNAENCNKVFKANYKTMDIRTKLISVYTDDALKGVGVLAVDGWNNHTLEPIVNYIDSRACIPDPKNWQDDKMRFFGTELRKKLIELQNDTAYDDERVMEVENYVSRQLQEIDQDNDDVKDMVYTTYKKGLVDIYNHLTLFTAEGEEPALWLLTYGADRTTLIRAIKMRALTEGEKADSSKIDFGVKLFRAEPIQGSFAGASLIDDVGSYQTVSTYLTNLTIDQAAKAAFGGKTIVDDRLGIDIDQLANADPAGSVISSGTITDPGVSIQGGIYQEQVPQVNSGTQNTIGLMNQLADTTSGLSSITSGQSLPGDQTKAEIQTIQQNINQQLSFMATNYMESLTGLWESIYRSYAANMSPQRKKNIVVIDNDVVDAYGFKKHEFISKGDLYIVVKSKSAERIKQKQDFAVFFSLIGTMLQGLQPGTTKYNSLMRMLGDKSGIDGFDAETLYPLSADERQAYENLKMLNRDIELKTKPLPGEDHDVYINIYKTGLDTPARNKAIGLRESILKEVPKEAPVEGADTGGAARGMGASLVASQQAQDGGVTSLADVSV